MHFVPFSKNTHFQWFFMIFYHHEDNLEPLWAHLAATLDTFGSLWGYFGYLRVAWGDSWVILGLLWIYDACIWELGGAVFDLVFAR